MFTRPGHVLADPRLYPSDVHAIAGMLGGLSGAVLFIALIGALIGWAAAAMIDWLPAGIAIPVGIVGIFFVLGAVG
jgi:hypothetical protein